MPRRINNYTEKLVVTIVLLNCEIGRRLIISFVKYVSQEATYLVVSNLNLVFSKHVVGLIVDFMGNVYYLRLKCFAETIGLHFLYSCL